MSLVGDVLPAFVPELGERRELMISGFQDHEYSCFLFDNPEFAIANFRKFVTLGVPKMLMAFAAFTFARR